MKTRIALGLIGSLFIANAQAGEAFCGYKDYFHLKSKRPIYISQTTHDADIVLEWLSPRSFNLRDTNKCKNGIAHIQVVYDNLNWCIFDITDGPFMLHPVVNEFCHGIAYTGISYDGIGTYSYTINLI